MRGRYVRDLFGVKALGHELLADELDVQALLARGRDALSRVPHPALAPVPLPAPVPIPAAGPQAVWAGRWKAVRQNNLRKQNQPPLKIELYDLKADIRESNNAAAANPKVVARLKKIMTREHTPSEHYPIKPLD